MLQMDIPNQKKEKTSFDATEARVKFKHVKIAGKTIDVVTGEETLNE